MADESTMFPKKLTSDGTPNKDYVDYLDEDRDIPSQRYVCLSFLSPNDILKRKDLFFFQEFLKFYEVKTNVDKFTDFLSFLAEKYNIRLADIMQDFTQFIQLNKETINETKIGDAWAAFMTNHRDTLQLKFNAANRFQTNVQGVKVRGAYATYREADVRAQVLRKLDNNKHNVFIAEVGKWLPWNPAPEDVKSQEYAEEQLNELMKKKMENDIASEQHFNEQKELRMKEAIRKNMENAADPSKLTQVLDAEGNIARREIANAVVAPLTSAPPPPLPVTEAPPNIAEAFETVDLATVAESDDQPFVVGSSGNLTRRVTPMKE